VPISDRFACELGSDRWLGRTRYNPLEMARLDVKVDLQIKPSAFEMFPGTLSVSKADQQHTVKCAAIASIKFQICFSNTPARDSECFLAPYCDSEITCPKSSFCSSAFAPLESILSLYSNGYHRNFQLVARNPRSSLFQAQLSNFLIPTAPLDSLLFSESFGVLRTPFLSTRCTSRQIRKTDSRDLSYSQ
jgi:hypothetical protein